MRSIVRRDSSVHMGPSGEMRNEERKSAALQGSWEAGTYEAAMYEEFQANHQARGDMCDDAFSYGNLNKNNCTADDHELIYTQSECIRAAAEANVTVNSDFSLNAEWYDLYPKGCFRAACGTKTCFFYNADGDMPENPQGYPVCTRPRYLNGTIETLDDGTKEAKCPAGYEIMDNQTVCENAADCEGFGWGEDGNGENMDISVPVYGNRMNYPHGCFIDTSSDKGGNVYFNPVDDANKPTNPVGIPLCRAPNELTDPDSS